MIDKPIVITGTARSGTSIIAGIIQACGAWGGNVGGPHPDNRKGCFENLALRQLEKAHLRRMGFDPLAQNPLPETQQLDNYNYYHDVTGVIRGEGYASGAWYYKSPKACLTWPNWHKAFSGAKWVIVKRDVNDIINSCLKARMMRAYKDRAGWQGWVEHHDRKFAEICENISDVVCIWSDEIIRGAHDNMKSVVKWCGLTWNEAAVKEFVSPELYHLNGVLAHGKQG